MAAAGLSASTLASTETDWVDTTSRSHPGLNPVWKSGFGSR